MGINSLERFSNPSSNNCDFNRFDEFSVKPLRSFPPNAYRLCAMTGGVWEWTCVGYGANSYANAQADALVLRFHSACHSIRSV
ncbi:MAG: hypothetical protein AUI91_14925 [Acidobacteria bacterium 13_1_40CM_3_56_11]|nr:MAG: hypothetical protein AUI91_14925 [Acidobacteria bacterium 13_1_40CM_3_56_11]